jgi:hypothetical protein
VRNDVLSNRYYLHCGLGGGGGLAMYPNSTQRQVKRLHVNRRSGLPGSNNGP